MFRQCRLRNYRKGKKRRKNSVIGNGDVFSKEKAEELFKVSGCDAIMVARGAIGSPWIFAELLGKEFTGSKFDVMK
ncbi:MAG: tRNA-dihydrouridine synthase, partial [Clostridia bacterium]|nr:tRNA-dihydrouridine synthase [Clostridia bacterium]